MHFKKAVHTNLPGLPLEAGFFVGFRLSRCYYIKLCLRWNVQLSSPPNCMKATLGLTKSNKNTKDIV